MDWREKLFGKVLVKCESGTQNGKFENTSTLEALSDCIDEGEGAVCGIYFSFANISDTSDDFGVRLEEVYKRVHPRLRVVQVVLWAHVGTPEGLVEREAGFRRSLTGKPWYAVPFHDVDTKVHAMAPLDPHDGTLGERHQHYNKLLKEAIDKGQPVGDFTWDDTDAENLLKIDLACHNRNVDYIINVFKRGDIDGRKQSCGISKYATLNQS